MNIPSSSQTRRAQEIKAIWALSKQTLMAAKAWVNRSSNKPSVGQAGEQVGNIDANGDIDPSFSVSTSTSNPFGNAPSPKYAVEDPAVSISIGSLGSASTIATVADSPVSRTEQISLPAPSLNHSNEDNGASLHHQAGSFFGDIVRHLPGTSLIAATEEDLEMAIVPARNLSSRQSADPDITSLNSPSRIAPSATLVGDPAPQPVDPKVDLIERQIQIKRRFHVHTIIGIIACIVSVVGAVATAYAAFRHGGSP